MEGTYQAAVVSLHGSEIQRDYPGWSLYVEQRPMYELLHLCMYINIFVAWVHIVTLSVHTEKFTF